MKTSLRIASIQRIAGLAVLITAVALNVMLITGCDDGGGDNQPVVPYVPYQPPPPTATFKALEFYPSSWGESGEEQAEQWETNNQIKLSSFYTEKKPKQGDVLRFRISGKSDTPLKYIKIELGECLGGKWDTYNYLGSSWTGGDNRQLINLSTSFNNVVIDVPIYNTTNSNASIYIQLVNLLWQKGSNGEYKHNSDETLDDVGEGTVMATVTNFSISLLSITSNKTPQNAWSKWVAEDATASLDYSVANDGVCTITVGGTAQANNESDGWGRWKASAQYTYTAKAGKRYIYKFEAWTDSGDRELRVQYYNDTANEVYKASDVSITNTRTTYTIYGEALPKGGERWVEFQCADQTGTFYVKMISIQEITGGGAPPSPPSDGGGQPPSGGIEQPPSGGGDEPSPGDGGGSAPDEP